MPLTSDCCQQQAASCSESALCSSNSQLPCLPAAPHCQRLNHCPKYRSNIHSCTSLRACAASREDRWLCFPVPSAGRWKAPMPCAHCGMCDITAAVPLPCKSIGFEYYSICLGMLFLAYLGHRLAHQGTSAGCSDVQYDAS